MKSVINPYCKSVIYACVFTLFYSQSIQAQQPINSIITSSGTSSQVSHAAVKGAGLANTVAPFLPISAWDSVGSSYNVNFNAPSNSNTVRLNQFSVGGFASNLMTLPVPSYVKVRRTANAEINDTRNYYNFWARYSNTPGLGANNGTFNFTAPEVTDPEQAFSTNNLTSGYDNIFQNTMAYPHFSNIERIDYIIPAGLYCLTNTDRQQSGVAVIDRGSGDAFKVAIITAIDASGIPTAFGNLVSVTAGDFGGDLLGSTFNYAILINDPKFKSESRPSTRSFQNLRGVYVSLGDMGVTVGQRFYGYAIFGPDVTIASPDWNTYPTNTSGNSELDPVNVMGMFKTPGSVLPVSLSFSAERADISARLNITLYSEFDGDHLVVQQSNDGKSFRDLGNIYPKGAGNYTYIDEHPGSTTSYYRVQTVEKNGKTVTSEMRMVKFEDKVKVSIFPNPVSDKLNIRFPNTWAQQAVTAEVFTATGQLVKRLRFDQAGISQSIPIHSMQAGAYMLRLTNNKDLSISMERFTVL
jgi:hypothetical protein